MSVRIVCVGGGPAGLVFAILMKLRDRKHEVMVLERNPPGSTYGWGVVFEQSLLVDLGARDPHLARAIAADSVSWSDQVFVAEGRPPIRCGGHGLSIGRQRVLDSLTRRANDLGVDVQFEREIEHAAQVPAADLIVGADGANSRVRRLDREHFRPHVSEGLNRYVWLGSSKVFDAFTFSFARTDAGWIWFHAYAFEPKTSTVVVECSGETWRNLGFPESPVHESVALLERIFASSLDGKKLLANVQSDSGGLLWRNFHTVTNENWHSSNKVLIGDAAHTTHFSLGSGMQLAIQDAIGLAASLHEGTDMSAALAAYERRRRGDVARSQLESRLSAQWFEDVSRYLALDDRQAFALLRRRRSAILPRMSPQWYYRFDRATRVIPLSRRFRDLMSAKLKAGMVNRRPPPGERPLDR